MTRTTARYAVEDGILRNPQVDFDALGEGPWDGIRRSYIPRPELAVDPSTRLHTDAELDVDPITYQVLRSRLWHQNLEHGDIIQRVTGSPPVIYSKDFATAVLTEDGELVTVSPTIQFFSALADLVVKWTLEHRGANPGIAPGDVFLQNSPYVAAGQQPDTAVFAPVFHDGKLYAWVYNALHMGDLGGVDPGGWAVHARDKFEDGIATAPVKIVEGGRAREDVIGLWVNQSRDPGIMRLNVNSGIAGSQAMVARITGLVDEYGPAVLKGVMRRMIADCSRVVGERLLQIPDGSWSQRLHVSGALGEDHRIHQEVLTITKRGQQVICTNAGTSPQGGPGNSTYSVLRSAVVAALASAVGWDQQGCMAGIADHVVLEPVFGTRSCADPPAATSALHSVFVTMNLAGLAIGTMLMSGPPELRQRTSASGGLSVPMADIAFGLDENMSLIAPPVSIHGGLLGGGIGAFPNRDGTDNGGSWFMLGTSAGNVEPLEQDGVGLVLYRRELRDGGGPGRWRGGNGIEAAWIPHHAFLSNAQMVFVEPSANLAAGLAGGYYALAGNFLRSTGGAVARALTEGRVPGDREQLEEETGDLHRLHPQAVLMPVPPGDAIVVEHNGGGGFGDPLDREQERVAADVAHGSVSAAAARKFWGVVLDGPQVDETATLAAREEIRRQRLDSATAPGRPTPRPDGAAETLLPGAGGSVDLARVGDRVGWTCARCGHWLAPADRPFQDGAAVAEQAPHEVDPRLYPDPAEYGDPTLVLRQYYCPGCAALLSQQFCRSEDGPASTIHIDLGTVGTGRSAGR